MLALGSGDGRDAAGDDLLRRSLPRGDYLDGILARVTGQYSRLGALMDPLIDRLVVICGVIVTWHFELLPRWALAVLIAREAVMVVVVLAGLRLGLDLDDQLDRPDRRMAHHGCVSACRPVRLAWVAEALPLRRARGVARWPPRCTCATALASCRGCALAEPRARSARGLRDLIREGRRDGRRRGHRGCAR